MEICVTYLVLSIYIEVGNCVTIFVLESIVAIDLGLGIILYLLLGRVQVKNGIDVFVE